MKLFEIPKKIPEELKCLISYLIGVTIFATVSTFDRFYLAGSGEFASFSKTGYFVNSCIHFGIGFLAVDIILNYEEFSESFEITIPKSLLFTLVFVAIIDLFVGPAKILWDYPFSQLVGHIGIYLLSGGIVCWLTD